MPTPMWGSGGERNGVRLAHGEYKTAGGKLVIVDFRISSDRLTDVVVSGDFFLEPPEALDLINSALVGLPVTLSESEFAEAITAALPQDVEMVGFSPEAIGIAVRRGLQ